MGWKILGYIYLASPRCSRRPTRYPKNSYHNPRKFEEMIETKCLIFFFFSHRSRDSMFRNRETRGQEVSGTAILIFGCSFFRPHPSAILSPRIIRHRLHTRAHTPFDTCIFIPPPRFHGEISGLERATPSNCALWKRRVFEKYRVKKTRSWSFEIARSFEY